MVRVLPIHFWRGIRLQKRRGEEKKTSGPEKFFFRNLGARNKASCEITTFKCHVAAGTIRSKTENCLAVQGWIDGSQTPLRFGRGPSLSDVVSKNMYKNLPRAFIIPPKKSPTKSNTLTFGTKHFLWEMVGYIWVS